LSTCCRPRSTPPSICRAPSTSRSSQLHAETIAQLDQHRPVAAYTNARELIERLPKRDLRTAIVTTLEGRLIGVFYRADAERWLVERKQDG
jgi:hypothetical protein